MAKANKEAVAPPVDILPHEEAILQVSLRKGTGNSDKLLSLTALRDVKLNIDTKTGNRRNLNLNRGSNLEALMIQVTGLKVKSPCDSCKRSAGPFAECVISDICGNGACASCHYNSLGRCCSFHIHNSVITPTMEGESDNDDIDEYIKKMEAELAAAKQAMATAKAKVAEEATAAAKVKAAKEAEAAEKAEAAAKAKAAEEKLTEARKLAQNAAATASKATATVLATPAKLPKHPGSGLPVPEAKRLRIEEHAHPPRSALRPTSTPTHPQFADGLARNMSSLAAFATPVPYMPLNILPSGLSISENRAVARWLRSVADALDVQFDAACNSS